MRKAGSDAKSEIGVVGLGVMGRNLVLNISDHGFPVAGYDHTARKVEALAKEGGENISASGEVREFMGLLRRPRAVLLLVPAGPPVDAVVGDIMPYLERGDVIIDGGNSHFVDTDRRHKDLSAKGLHFLGMGVSGGERGARFGPSMMPGGPREAYDRLAQVFEAVSAHVNGDACVTYLGPRSAGHYVKMVHNGIEYGIIQLIAETYDLMKRGLGLSNDDLHAVYEEWNGTEVQSFLVEITSKIFLQRDDRTEGRLIDRILDKAKQKGTGKWTSQEAMELQLPVPTIDAAVVARDLSAQVEARKASAETFSRPAGRIGAPREEFLPKLRNALYFAMVAAYAQGMDLLRQGSEAHGYGLPLHEVAKIWRGGCIIRSGLLEPIRQAFADQPKLPNLMTAPAFSKELGRCHDDVRSVIIAAAQSGLPVPAMMASIAYFDALRSGWLPANLIQAQRDFFGSHTYERTDADGIFHTVWQQ
jgi:6-phosphogluconate dehydrogenase